MLVSAVDILRRVGRNVPEEFVRVEVEVPKSRAGPGAAGGCLSWQG